LGGDVATERPAAPASADSSPSTTPGPVDRASAFAGGPPAFPRKALFAIVGTVVAVAILVAVVDRIAASSTSGSGTLRPLTSHAPVGGSSAPSGSAALHAPLSSLLGVTSLTGQVPAPWSLTDAATGQTVSLRSLRGRVVVVTFANASCDDICPVLGAELSQARARLGTTRVPVTFVTINTDPLALGAAKASILHAPAFAHLTGWRFLTGTVATLNPVWTDYGISIRVNTSDRRVSHNDLMYFVAPDGKLAWSAIPFADEAKDGSFSLSSGIVTRFADGIATYAGKLANTP
jgi:cytochrome oxidase Cu insertion factor (SCO1/SenC/PrrC family)